MAQQQKKSKTTGCMKTAAIGAGKVGADYLEKRQDPKSKKAGQYARKFVNVADAQHHGGDPNAAMLAEGVGVIAEMARKFGCGQDGAHGKKQSHKQGDYHSNYEQQKEDPNYDYTQVYGDYHNAPPSVVNDIHPVNLHKYGDSAYGQQQHVGKSKAGKSNVGKSSMKKSGNHLQDPRYEDHDAGHKPAPVQRENILQRSYFGKNAWSKAGPPEDQVCGMPPAQAYTAVGAGLAVGIGAFFASQKLAGGIHSDQSGVQKSSGQRSSTMFNTAIQLVEKFLLDGNQNQNQPPYPQHHNNGPPPQYHY